MPQSSLKPPQFGLKHALVALSYGAVCLAALRLPEWSFYGWFGIVLAVGYSWMLGARAIDRLIMRLAELDVSPIRSGAAAAAGASFGVTVTNACLAELLKASSMESDLKALLTLVVFGIYYFIGLITMLLLLLLAVKEQFRLGRPAPAVASCLVNALIGFVLISLFDFFRGTAHLFEPPFGLPRSPIEIFIVGPVIGTLFGSAGFYAHCLQRDKIRANAAATRASVKVAKAGERNPDG